MTFPRLVTLNTTKTCYAKLNLSLRVYKAREDGYHPIYSVFQSVSLADTLSINVMDGPVGMNLTCSNPSVPVDHRNSLFRVYEDFKEHLPYQLNVHIEKQIPIGAGLGGGSSNAAAFLVAVHQIMGVSISPSEMMALGLKYGADIPFFVQGGTALVRGIGEQITPIEKGPYSHFVLLYPNIHSSTQDVYQSFDQLPFQKEQVQVSDLDTIEHVGENDLKQIVFAQYPELRDIELWATQHQQITYMSGSGSTLFWPFKETSHAEQWYKAVTHKYPHYKCFLTESR